MSKAYWHNRIASPQEKETLLLFVRKVYGEDFPDLNRSYWEWRYTSNPACEVEFFVAEFEKRPIAVLPTAVFDFQWSEQIFPAVMLTGLVTHPEHRRRGIFRSLISSINEHGHRHGRLFNMGMPNDIALPGYLKFGGWEYPGKIRLYAKVLDYSSVFRDKLPNPIANGCGSLSRLLSHKRSRQSIPLLEAELVSRVPEEFDQICNNFTMECNHLMIRRNAAYWQWRYLMKPNSNYRTLLARNNGRLIGAVVTSVQRRAGLTIGLILDIVGHGDNTVIVQLLRLAENDLRDLGVGLVTSQATSKYLQQFLRHEGYRAIPSKLLPKQFHYVYRPLGVSGLPFNPSKMSDWHLTFGDSDNT
ncbi:GNAT family N-acetyltransferase [Acidobacteriota bacterium]